MSEILQQKLHNKINNLLDDYKEHPEMIEKIDDYICNILPNTLRNLNNTQLERENRKNNLEEKSILFMQTFLKESPYYYCNTTEIFFEYKNYSFNCIREDSVLCNILNSISSNKELLPWKYKIKISLMKRIKDLDIFHCTPNSETIQHALNIIEEICNLNKEQAKYFLTVIGDVILKKNNNVYFINSNIKHLLKELSNHGYLLFGSSNFTNHFKYKFHDHKYEECRMIDFKGKISENTVKEALKNNNINILLVAIYFSNRFGNGDSFINEFCKNNDVKNHALYLKNSNEESIMKDFMKVMTEDSIENNINWKDIGYLWKLYNENNNYPNIMFSNRLQELITFHYNEKYNKEQEVLSNITSSYLPDVKHFIEFWSKEIYDTEEQHEYEVDELYYLFQQYYKSTTMSEEKLLSLIRHYYPDILIEDDKYILNIGCLSWCKKDEAQEFLKNNKSLIEGEINIDEIYECYKKTHNNAKRRLSKRFLEKVVIEITWVS